MKNPLSKRVNMQEIFYLKSDFTNTLTTLKFN